MTITSLTADHALDLGGYGEPMPQFGINFTARCDEPASAPGYWTIKAGIAPSEEVFVTCIDGSFGGVPQTLAVKGCGEHDLTVTVRKAVTDRLLSGPIRFSFNVC